MNMTPADPGFTKDVAEPRLAFDRVRALLKNPLELPALGDELSDGLSSSDPAAWWALAAGLLEAGRAEAISETGAPGPDLDALDASLRAPIEVFYRRAAEADSHLQRAFAAVSAEDRAIMTTIYLNDTFNPEDHESVREAMLVFGCEAAAIDRAIEESMALDPRPAASNFLDRVERIVQAELIAAAARLDEGLRELEALLPGAVWPDEPVTLETPLGAVVIGTPGDDVYTNAALLVLEPGEDERYTEAAGSVDGRARAALSAVLELAGRDRYAGDGVLAPGAALFGVQVLIDAGGDDVYEAAYIGQGAGLFGAARLEDRGGDDVYRGHALVQGAGYAGAGLLRDGGGRDLYDAGFFGQGFAGVRGVGLLVDEAGNDRYLAGGRLPDFDRNPERFVSMAQGCALGLRPFAGGGVAALVDRGGSDTYVGDVFAQGTAYWYGAGLLIDDGGEDTYELFQYGQGAGIHLSLGLLADRGGYDRYTGHGLCQGSAHDYAVGMMLELGGDDVYTGDRHAQGRAIHNAFALLLDAGGDDRYLASNPARCQGIGRESDLREYGSLALMIDLGGLDRYACGAEDGARLERPDYGIVYDWTPEGATP